MARPMPVPAPVTSATRPSRFIVVSHPAAPRSLLFDFPGKFGGSPVLHRLQMLAVQDQLARHLENFVGYFDHSHGGVLRPFFEIGADGVNGVSDEYGFDETQLIVAVAKGMNIIVRHQAQADAEHHGAGNQALTEYAFLFGEN